MITFNGILWAYQNARTGFIMKIFLFFFPKNSTNSIFYRMRSEARGKKPHYPYVFEKSFYRFYGPKNKILLMVIIIDMGFVMRRKGLVSSSLLARLGFLWASFLHNFLCLFFPSFFSQPQWRNVQLTEQIN